MGGETVTLILVVAVPLLVWTALMLGMHLPGYWCATLPWHRRWEHVKYLSPRAEVRRCRCGKEWAINHDVEAVIPYDTETKAFYEKFGGRMF